MDAYPPYLDTCRSIPYANTLGYNEDANGVGE